MRLCRRGWLSLTAFAACSETGLGSRRDITHEHVRDFAAKYRNPSIHVNKARIWNLGQFIHFLKLNGWVDRNIASDLPYPKIEKVDEFVKSYAAIFRPN